MASETEICNGALIKLGADTILSLTDSNNRARVMNARYASVRDAELTRHRWHCSITRAQLPALSDAPLSDYAYQYQLPADFLRLIEGGDVRSVANLADYRSGGCALYSIEGGKILTNLPPPLNIRYLGRVTDTGLYPATLCEALSSRLAWENCERITQSDSKRQLAKDDYKEAIREGLRANAREAAPQDIGDDTWVMARLG